MRRAALVIAILGAPATAAAEDPDSLFGFHKDPPPVEVEEHACADDVWDFRCAGEGGQVRETLTRDALWDLGAGDGSWITGARRALGASQDPFAAGPAFAGASAVENRWTLDGLPVDAVTDGSPELRVPLMFLSSLDVISGGMPASSRASTGAVIDGHLRGGGDDDQGMEVRLWLGAAGADRARPAVPDEYTPLELDADPLRSVTVLATAGGRIDRLRVIHAWWFAGFGLEADDDDATRIARTLQDDDGDGLYDRNDDRTLITRTVDARGLDGSALSLPYLARFGGALGHHAAAFTVIGAASEDQRRSALGTTEATTVDRRAMLVDVLGTWTSRWGATELKLSAGWHHARRTEAGADGVQIGTAYVPVALDDDARFSTACMHDLSELDPCPLATGYYVRGGAGLLTATTADRPTIAADLARAIRRHRVAIGATMEDARLRLHRRFSGGVLERRLAEDIVFSSEYVEADGGKLDSSTRIYRTRSIAGYVEDAWRPTRGVTVQGGLRWESMEVGTNLRFRDQLAPRLAISADPTERGKSRLFLSWGRYFPLLPASLGPDVVGTDDLLTSLDSGLGHAETIRSGDPLPIDDAIEAPMVEELIAGAEAVVVDRLHVGFTYRARWLRRGLEDVAGTFTNPAQLRRDSRDYLAWFGNAPDADVHVRVGYARTRQDGSWTGVYQSTFENQPNSYGRLSSDTPHRLFVEAIGHRGALTFGTRFQIASGTPVGAVAGADGEVPLLPRGSVGRTPTTSSVTVHVGWVHGPWTVGLDVVDVFDRRVPVAVDQRWTTDDVRPIEGGDDTDLLWLRTIDGDRARVNPGFGVATRYALPVTARLSATLTY